MRKICVKLTIVKILNSYTKDENGNLKSNNAGCAFALAFFLAGPSFIVSLYMFITNPAEYWKHLAVSAFLLFSLFLLIYRLSKRSMVKRKKYVDDYQSPISDEKGTIEGDFKDVTESEQDSDNKLLQ